MNNHKNAECFCAAIHESLFKDAQSERVDASNIIATIFFRMLKDSSDSGVYIYYLCTLQGKTFAEETSVSSFEHMKCGIEGHGLGELLLRNTQLFCQGVRDTYDLYLGVIIREKKL